MFASEFFDDPGRVADFNSNVLSKHAAVSPANLLVIVTESYLFELMVFYASVRRAWTFFPWRIFAYSPEQETVSRIEGLDLPGLQAIHLPHAREGGWAKNAALKVELVERSGLDSGVVSDLDDIFLAETPELQLFLTNNDFVFVGAPHTEQLIQTSLWGFRRTPAAIRFARRWAEQSEGRRRADASGLPFALEEEEEEDEDLRILVLAKPKVEGAFHHQCPYDVQANIRPFSLRSGPLGYSETYMGLAKVIHFGGLRSEGSDSPRSRMKTMHRQFPESRAVFSLYLDCANEAGQRLGMDTVSRRKAILDGIPQTALAWCSKLRRGGKKRARAYLIWRRRAGHPHDLR
jgi:hypothetical protein